MQVGELWVRLGLDKKSYDRGINDAKGQANNFGSFLKNAFQFTVGQGMFDLMKQGMKSAWDMSIGFNSQMQQNSIAFENMLGSADKSKRLLGELADMAANTPFELPQLTDASKKLLAFGFSASYIKSILTSVGDAASGLGLGAEGINRITIALGQMKAKAKVSAQEMMQLTETGIPAWDILAKAMGKSTAEVMKLSEQGLIPADQAISQLIDGMEKKFPGMMSKQSKSFSGLMSTIKDNVQMTLGDIMKPAFEDLTNNVLPSVVNKLNTLRQAFKLEGIKGVLTELIPPSLRIGITTLTGAFIAYKGAVILSTIVTQVQGIAMAISAVRSIGLSAATEAMAMNMKGATIAQWGLNTAMNSNPLGIVITFVGTLIGALVGLKGILGSNTEETLKLKETMLQSFDEEKQKAIDSINARREAELDGLNSRRNALDQDHSNFIEKLNKEYGAYKETQKSMTDIAKEEGEARKKALDDEYNARIKLLQDQTNANVKVLQQQIDDIDSKTKSEDDADRDVKEQEKVRLLQNQIANAKNIADKKRLENELAELLKDINRRKLLNERETQKESLKKQMEAIKEDSKKKEEVLREQLLKEKEMVDKSVEDKIEQINIERKAKEEAEKLKYEAAKTAVDSEITKINEKYDLESKREEDLYNQKVKHIDELAQKQQEDKSDNQALYDGVNMVVDWESGSWWDKAKMIFKVLNGNPFSGYATGTDSATRGYHQVAEKGFEIVTGGTRYFNGGEKVLNHDDSVKALSGMGGINLYITNFNGTQEDIKQLMKEIGYYQKSQQRGLGLT